MMIRNQMTEIVENIREMADELLAKGRGNLDPVEYGELLAYCESLCIIRDSLPEQERAAVGLDFDIDAKYLQQEPCG